MKKLLYKYKNGNATTSIFDDGTKITETQDNEFQFNFPENFDFKITNSCPYGCKFCHENSVPDGKHADLKNMGFLNSLHPGTECAIGGGSVLAHPDFEWLLNFFKEGDIIANVTFNQREIESNTEYIQELINKKLIWGIGISFVSPSNKLKEFIQMNKNVVVHLIAGIHSKKDLDWLAECNAKILILGYKNLRRGEKFKLENQEDIKEKINFLKNCILDYRESFKTISFDNLALEQLNIQSQIPQSIWESYYQGSDGSRTMYIDGPNNEFAVSSTSLKRYKINDLGTIDEMFNIIQEAKNDVK